MVAAVVVDDVVAVTANHRHANLVSLILGCSLDMHVSGKSLDCCYLEDEEDEEDEEEEAQLKAGGTLVHQCLE